MSFIPMTTSSNPSSFEGIPSTSPPSKFTNYPSSRHAPSIPRSTPPSPISNAIQSLTSAQQGAVKVSPPTFSCLRIFSVRDPIIITTILTSHYLPLPESIWVVERRAIPSDPANDLAGFWLVYENAQTANTVFGGLDAIPRFPIDRSIYPCLPSIPGLHRLPIVFRPQDSVVARLRAISAELPILNKVVNPDDGERKLERIEPSFGGYSFRGVQSASASSTTTTTTKERSESSSALATSQTPADAVARRLDDDDISALDGWPPASFRGDRASLESRLAHEKGRADVISIGDEKDDVEERARRILSDLLDGDVDGELDADLTLEDLTVDGENVGDLTIRAPIGSDSSSGRDGDDEDEDDGDDEGGSGSGKGMKGDNDAEAWKNRFRSHSVDSVNTADTSGTGTSTWWNDIDHVLQAFPSTVARSEAIANGLVGSSSDGSSISASEKNKVPFPTMPEPLDLPHRGNHHSLPPAPQPRLVPLPSLSSPNSLSSRTQQSLISRITAEPIHQCHFNKTDGGFTIPSFAPSQYQNHGTQNVPRRATKPHNLNIVVPPHPSSPLPSLDQAHEQSQTIPSPFTFRPHPAMNLNMALASTSRPPNAIPTPVSAPAPSPAAKGTTPATTSQCVLTPDGKALACAYGPWELVEVSSNPVANSVLLNWPAGYPLPRSCQVRPHAENDGYPPIMNTGNTGPLQEQPGDWRCGVCNYTNWLRRRVCQSCYPYADGNMDASKAVPQMERVNAIATQLMLADQSRMASLSPMTAPSSAAGFAGQHLPNASSRGDPRSNAGPRGPMSAGPRSNEEGLGLKSTIAFPSLPPITPSSAQAQVQPLLRHPSQSQMDHPLQTHFTSTTAFRTSSVRAPVAMANTVPMQRQYEVLGSPSITRPALPRAFVPHQGVAPAGANTIHHSPHQSFVGLNSRFDARTLASPTQMAPPRMPSPPLPPPLGWSRSGISRPPPITVPPLNTSPTRSLRSSVSSNLTFGSTSTSISGPSSAGWSISGRTAFSSSTSAGSVQSSPVKTKWGGIFEPTSAFEMGSSSGFGAGNMKYGVRNGSGQGMNVGVGPVGNGRPSRGAHSQMGSLHSSASMSNLLGGSNHSSFIKSSSSSPWRAPTSVPTTPLSLEELDLDEDVFWRGYYANPSGVPTSAGSNARVNSISDLSTHRRVTLPSSGLFNSGSIW